MSIFPLFNNDETGLALNFSLQDLLLIYDWISLISSILFDLINLAYKLFNSLISKNVKPDNSFSEKFVFNELNILIFVCSYMLFGNIWPDNNLIFSKSDIEYLSPKASLLSTNGEINISFVSELYEM